MEIIVNCFKWSKHHFIFMLDIFYAVSIIIFVNISQFVEGHFVFSNSRIQESFAVCIVSIVSCLFKSK